MADARFICRRLWNFLSTIFHDCHRLEQRWNRILSIAPIFDHCARDVDRRVYSSRAEDKYSNVESKPADLGEECLSDRHRAFIGSNFCNGTRRVEWITPAWKFTGRSDGFSAHGWSVMADTALTYPQPGPRTL